MKNSANNSNSVGKHVIDIENAAKMEIVVPPVAASTKPAPKKNVCASLHCKRLKNALCYIFLISCVIGIPALFIYYNMRLQIWVKVNPVQRPSLALDWEKLYNLLSIPAGQENVTAAC